MANPEQFNYFVPLCVDIFMICERSGITLAICCSKSCQSRKVSNSSAFVFTTYEDTTMNDNKNALNLQQ